jgi:hypothetical protein
VKPNAGKPKLHTSRAMIPARAMIAARVVIAAVMLLTLVAGSIVWPAYASGPMCSMACCAGKAPHAAGSCTHGSCETGVVTPQPASGAEHAHHHHQQQEAAAADNNAPAAFAGALASAGGMDMRQVPTVEAVPYQAPPDNTVRTASSGTAADVTSISSTALTQPCEPGCGACVAGSTAPGRQRNSAALPATYKPTPPSSIKLGSGRHALTLTHSVFSRQGSPRGPPVSFS